MAKFVRIDIGGNRKVLVNRTNTVVDGYRRLIAAEDTQAPSYIRRGEIIYVAEDGADHLSHIRRRQLP